jgi:hypothetical protein
MPASHARQNNHRTFADQAVAESAELIKKIGVTRNLTGRPSHTDIRHGNTNILMLGHIYSVI